MATSSTRPAAKIWLPTSPAFTATIRSPASSLAVATAAVTSRAKWYDASGCQPSGLGRCETTTTWSPAGGFPSQPFTRSNRVRPITIVPIEAHIGRTYSAEARETMKRLPVPEWSYGWSPPSVIGVSPLKYQSWSGPTSSLSSAMKPSTDTTLCMITVPTAAPWFPRAVAHDLVVPGGGRACKKSIGGHRAEVRRVPRLGGIPAPQGQVFRRGVPGEVLELPAEVGLVEVARRVGEFRPVDRAPGVHGHDQLGEAVDPRHPLRGDPDMGLELRGQVSAAHPGGVGQRTHRDRATGSLQAPGCVPDQAETARRRLGEPRSQFPLQYPQRLGGRRAVAGLVADPVQGPWPDGVDRHPPVP